MVIRMRWVFALVMVAFFTGVLVLGLALVLSTSISEIDQDSWLVVDLDGEIFEDIPAGQEGALFFDDSPTLWDFVSAIDKAASDDRIAATIVKVRSPGWGWAKIEELRAALQRFKKSGKPVIGWFESGSDPDYYLASVADSLYSASGANLHVNGLGSFVTFYKGTLDWAGVVADLESVGEYKSANEQYQRNQMSEPSREAMEAMLDDHYSNYVETISEARDWDVEETRQRIDQGPYSGEEALTADIVDALRFESELDEAFYNNHSGSEISIYDYIDEISKDRGPGPRIALVFASGTIVRGESGFDPFWGRTLGSETFRLALEEAVEDERVKAIVLRVDSPGGDAYASRAMWHDVREAATRKPVIASFSDLAASGGYYLAMGADTILAWPGTITGSIGVVGGKFNIAGLYKKLGLDVEVISRGKNAEFYSPLRNFTPQEREKLLAQLWQDYRLFLEAVVENRKKPEEEVEQYARGRVWTGSQAYINGLVDKLGGFEESIMTARGLAGIEPDEKVQFEVYPKVERTFLQQIVADLFLVDRMRTVMPRLPGSDLLGSVRQLQDSSSLTWMPYHVAIH